MGVDFSPEQKRWIEGFTSGAAAVRGAVRSGPVAASPAAPAPERRSRKERVMLIVWPVKRSAPAKTTRINARPNAPPITSGRTLGSSTDPRLKIRRMPKPT